MHTLIQDLRYGARALLKNPGFAGVVTFTLALAIGANSVLFSFVNVLLLRPLPIKDLETMAFIEGLNSQRADDFLLISEPDYLDYRERARSFEDTGAYRLTAYTLTGDGDPQRAVTGEATASFFDIWGLDAVRGRTFTEAEDRPGAPGVVMLSHGFWVREFASDPSIVGRMLTLNGKPHTVVGVVSPRIEIGTIGKTELWVPLAADGGGDRNDRRLRVFGRLADQTSVGAASNEVAAIALQLQEEYPDSNTGFEAVARGGRESLMGGANTRLIFTLLSVVVLGVLAVACANVANLMLSRAVGRRRELALRSALGASRTRVIRQLLTESFLLSVLGGLGGLAMAAAAMRLIRAVSAEPIFEMIVVERDVLLFAAALALITPLIFSLFPALQASRTDVSEALKENGGRSSGGLRGSRSRATLVVSQLALACSLLIGSGLVVRTVYEIVKIDWGFDHRNLLTFQVELPEVRYVDAARLRGFFDESLRRIRAVPGVSGAAAVAPMPIFGGERTVKMEVEGREASRPEDQPWAVLVVASDAYLETIDLPLLRGRPIDQGDAPDGARVAVVTRELARRYWPDEDAIGKRLALVEEGAAARTWLEVVGVVGDLRSPDITDAPKPTVLVPLAQQPPRLATFMVRGTRGSKRVGPGHSPGSERRRRRAGDLPGQHDGADQPRASVVGSGSPGDVPGLRDHRVAHGRFGPLRDDVLQREPKAPGDRDPHGARSEGPRRSVDGAGPGRAIDARQPRSRRAGRAGLREGDGERALRRHRGRPLDVRRCDADSRLGGSTRDLCARAPGHPGRPDPDAPGRVAQPDIACWISRNSRSRSV